MNKVPNIEIIKDTPNYIRFILWSSPQENNINFINEQKQFRRFL
jgi:hypothetical protein